MKKEILTYVISSIPYLFAGYLLGNGLTDIRKDEREKTIKEVLEYVESTETSGSDYWAELIKKHFLSSDPMEELAKLLDENKELGRQLKECKKK